MALAQNDAAIEQARLYQQAIPPVSIGVDANGTALAETESTSSDDDSFGAQQILKNQERARTVVVSGGASAFYTSNVGLTRRGEHEDAFAVVDAAINWSPRIGKDLEASVSLHASLFRYDKTPELDFENLGFGAGIVWNPPRLPGVGLFARYDFTELLGRNGRQILMDHSLTIGAQKFFALGRSHGISAGVTGVVGLADPGVAQRDQIGALINYHLQLTRKLDTDIFYRPALHFYPDAGRVDFNQIFSLNLRYRFTEWAELIASFSYGANRSDHSVFDYNVLSAGGGAGVNIRF